MKDDSQIRKVLTGFGVLEYTFTHKKVKNINLRIKKNKEILMSAPYGVPAERGDGFVLEKQKYIYDVLAKLSLMVPEVERSYIMGDQFYYMGKVLTLEVIENSKDNVVNEGERLYLYTKTPDDFKEKKKLVDKWFTVKRKSIYSKINAEVCHKFKKYKLPLAQLEVKHMTNKWGTCQPGRGVVTISAQLIDTPREAIEYVMVHEYAHFVHQDHSKSFYKVVEEIMPQWKENKKKLELSSFNKSF